jgi:hypothetical protein
VFASGSDADSDGVDDAADNCPLDYNPGQQNTDSGPQPPSGNIGTIDNGPDIIPDDVTVPNGDPLGDACDPDLDNDGLPNTDEDPLANCGAFNGLSAAHPNPGGGDITNDDNSDGNPAPPMGTDAADNGPSWDTDNDGVLDGYECANGSNPRDASSKPAVLPDDNADSDGDGLLNGWERRGWGTDPNSVDSDGDGLGDCGEAMDLDGDHRVNSTGDLIAMQRAIFGGVIFGVPPRKTTDFDVSKNGLVNTTDYLPMLQRVFGLRPCLEGALAGSGGSTGITLSLDADPSNGTRPCDPIDATVNVPLNTPYNVAVCLSNYGAVYGAPAAFDARVVYDGADVAQEVTDLAPALNDNPDANDGPGPNGVGTTGWICSGEGIFFPKGDNPNTPEHDASIFCRTDSTPMLAAEPGLLAMISFPVSSTPEIVTLTFSPESNIFGFDCPPDGASIVCAGASITKAQPPTNTPTRTATATITPTRTVTATNTPVPTATNTPVPTATNTPTPTATATNSPTATATPDGLVTGTPIATATAIVDAGGGTVVAGTGELVSFPPDAVGGGTLITLQVYDTTEVVTPPPGQGFVSHAINVLPEGLTFGAPVTITLAYTDADLAGGDPSSLAIWVFVGGSWQALGGTVNAVDHTVSVAVLHFTVYALLRDTSVPTPLPAETCNGVDDDHDGLVDDGFASQISAFRQPINDPASPMSVFKQKSTVPVNFVLRHCDGTLYSASEADAVASSGNARLYIQAGRLDPSLVVDEAVTSTQPDQGNWFRHAGSSQFIYNWGTKGYAGGGQVYTVVAIVTDAGGNLSMHAVNLALR